MIFTLKISAWKTEKTITFLLALPISLSSRARIPLRFRTPAKQAKNFTYGNIKKFSDIRQFLP